MPGARQAPLRSRRRCRPRPRCRSAGQSARRQGPRRHHGAPTGRIPGPRNRRPPARPRAVANRHQSHRRHDPHRPRPARADHWRPQDGEDDDCHRHDPEPEVDRREVLLRRHRPEGFIGRQLDQGAGRPRSHGLHDGHPCRGQFACFAASNRGNGGDLDGRVFHVQGRTRPDCVRRLVQASLGLSPVVAARSPSAGARSVPRRRVL